MRAPVGRNSLPHMTHRRCGAAPRTETRFPAPQFFFRGSERPGSASRGVRAFPSGWPLEQDQRAARCPAAAGASELAAEAPRPCPSAAVLAQRCSGAVPATGAQELAARAARRTGFAGQCPVGPRLLQPERCEERRRLVCPGPDLAAPCGHPRRPGAARAGTRFRRPAGGHLPAHVAPPLGFFFFFSVLAPSPSRPAPAASALAPAAGARRETSQPWGPKPWALMWC